MRQEVNAPLSRAKSLDSFPMDQNPKTRLRGRLREEAGPCSGHIFLFLKAGELPNHSCDLLLGGQRGAVSRDVP